MHRWASLLAIVLAAGCPPPAGAPAARPRTAETDLALLAHAWKIYGHVLADDSAISDEDAGELDGREVAITATSYESPWQGSCDDYGRTRRERLLVEVASELRIARSGLGLGDRVVEFRLSCQNRRSPPLTLAIDGQHALSCWTGACYLMSY